MTMKWLGPLLKILGTNWVTLFGANVTTISAIVIIAFLLLGFFGLVDSPYIALMALLVLPGFFIAGLLLIPLGLWLERRRKRALKEVEVEDTRPFPVIDFNRTTVRRVALSVVALTVINLLIVTLVSYEGVLYMDSTEFCGEVCHTVMEPEYAAYKNSPHSRVECVECHIGPGAPWFVRSKLSGMGQVIAVSLNTYERPIPTPVEDLRPSQDTCEQCHWPDRFSGDRVRVITRFEEDEANSPLKTVLVMHIGGGWREDGIHSWHINPARETYYVASDDQRQQMNWVQVREGDEVVEYVADGVEVDPAEMETRKRLMDCIDCHNRPTHIFHLPAEAMDLALDHGQVDRTIPYIKRVGTTTLQEVGDRLGSADEVVEALRQYYQEEYPDLYSSDRARIDDSIEAIAAIYRRNVFPKMDLAWGVYPNNIGHETFPGCFRCHDGSLSSSDGRVIEQECTTCHAIAAWGEENPEILTQLELE